MYVLNHTLCQSRHPKRTVKSPTTLSPAEEAILHSLYTSHYKTLLKSAQRLLHDRMASHDVVMDLLIHVSKRPNLALKARDLPYLVAAVGNRSINYLRKRQREKMTFLTISDLDNPSYCPGPDSAIVEKELEMHIRQAMKALPAKTRIIFYLHRRFNMTYHEIAKYKNMNIRTVEAHMSTALKSLRDAVLHEVS